MSYINSAKIFCDFNSFPLSNKVTGAALVYSGNATLTSGRLDQALLVDKLFEIPLTFPVTTRLTICFAIKSKNFGVAATGEALYLPVICKSGFASNSNGIGDVYPFSPLFMVYEKSHEGGLNSLIFSISGRTFASPSVIAVTIESSKYAAGEWNLFSLSYDATTRKLRIYKNLVLDKETSNVNISLLTTNSYAVRLNENVGFVPARLVARNTFELDELLITNDAIAYDDLIKIANNGAYSYADSFYNSLVEQTYPVIFDEPSATKITSTPFIRGNLFKGDSSGKIKKGYRKIWQTSLNFSDFNFSQSLLDSSSKDNTTFEVEDGVLKIDKQIVRL